MEPIIKVENLVHVYPGGVKALKGVNLAIQKGEVVAILGKNGSGKTTLVKHFNGLLKPTSGNVWIKGMNTREVSIARLSREVGYVFQNPNHQTFLPTVRDELSFGCRNLKLPEQEIKQRVKEVVIRFNLKDKLEDNPYDLNLSMRKTVAIASILAMRPAIIVLDEPTTGQDYAGCQQLLKFIRELEKEGHTVVIITHDMMLVGELNKRVVVMSNGEIIADNLPRVVFKDDSILQRSGLLPPQITELSRKLAPYGITDTALTIADLYTSLKER
ncbi:MAG: ABC transporter ATP-binding protein [Moorella humiferrea]|nr:ABC transporter ATP-binding protein [Moorella humiferrea]